MAITISGENNNDKILAADGVIDQISGINIVGVLTATTFEGNLTGNVTGNLTGNVNSTSPLLLQTGGSERFRITGNNELGIAGANYGSAGQVLTSGGSGSAVSWTTIPAQATIANNADNRVITGGSGVNLNGEANFTYDGSSCTLKGTTDGVLNLDTTDSRGSFIRFKQGGTTKVWVGSGQGLSLGDVDDLGLMATDNIIMRAGSSEKLRITSDGDVSISSNGTVAGVSKLTVLPANRTTAFDASDGDTWHDVVIKQGASATTNSVGIAFEVSPSAYHKNAGTGIVAIKDGNNFDYGTHLAFVTRPHTAVAEERVRILSGGNVGINESSPNFKLHVNGTGRFESDLSMNSGTKIYTNNSQGQLTIMGGATYPGGAIKFAGGQSGATDQGTMIFYAGSATSLEERLKITSNGNIEVKGTRAGSLQANDDDALKLYTKSTSASIDRGVGITFYTHDGSGYEMGGTIQVAKENASANNPASYMRFSTQSGSTTTERLRIASNGKIYVKGNGGDVSTNFSDEGTFLNLKHDTYGGRIGFSNGTASPGATIAEVLGYWGSNKVAGWIMTAGGDATNRDDGQMSFYTSESGQGMRERFYIGDEGEVVAGYRVGTSSVRSNQPVAFHSTNVTPHGNDRRVSTGQRCNLFVGSNSGWSAGDGGVIAMGGSETGGAGVEGTWAYITGKRQSGNGWEYAGYFEVGTSPYSGTVMARRMRIWANGQMEVYPTDNTFYSTQIGGAQRMIFKHTGGGNIEIENSNGTMTFDTSSDYRLKKDEVAISNALTTVKALKPYQYTWKHDGKLGQGFFAHEAQAVLPDIGVVSGTKDAVHAEDETQNGGQWKKGDPIYQQIDYSKLVPLLTAALQEETAKREALEARVAALESS